MSRTVALLEFRCCFIKLTVLSKWPGEAGVMAEAGTRVPKINGAQPVIGLNIILGLSAAGDGDVTLIRPRRTSQRPSVRQG